MFKKYLYRLKIGLYKFIKKKKIETLGFNLV